LVRRNFTNTFDIYTPTPFALTPLPERGSTNTFGVCTGIAFAKLYSMRGFATIFDNFTNIASAKIPL
jgi:hypothetical protein